MKLQKPANSLSKFTTLLITVIVLAFSLSCKQKDEQTASDVKEQTASSNTDNMPDQSSGDKEAKSTDLTQKDASRDRNDRKTSQGQDEQETMEPQASSAPMGEEKSDASKVDNTPEEPVLLAKVNGTAIYSTDLEGRPLEMAINREILYQAGLKKGLDVKLKDKIENFKKRAIVNELEQEILGDMPEMKEYTDKELEDYYNQNLKNFQYLKLKELSVDDRGVAEEIQKKALEGESFEKIASDLSESGVMVKTKDIGFTRRYGGLFDSVEVGSVGELVSEGNSFKILKIVEVKTIPMNLVKRNIILAVNNKKKQEVLRSKIDQLKKENDIEVTIVSNGGEK